MPPSTFLFDIGKVIIDFDFGITVAAISERCAKVSAAALLESVTDLTVDLEMGRLSVNEFATKAKDRTGFSGSTSELIDAFADVFELNKGVEQVINRLSGQGLPLFLLSNTNAIHVPFFTEKFSIFSQFQGAVYSHEAGCMKPDPRIFEIAIEEFGLVPGDTVYTDDLPANCETATKLGFHAICYNLQEHENYLDSLRQIDVDI